ncbi:MAG: SGNH/GDSL hydrolase family protein [Ruminococcaceae bacterium]|nr:SGNH/GDSL hydrolase family protein [Oscillospiraceae bacterium]
MDITKMFLETEKPLDNLVTDGGFCKIFRTIGCVGDSLASGEFETIDAEGKKSYHDLFEYSWGQYIARACGSKVYNFSRGGMTAKEYMESFAQAKDFWNPEKKAQAYIVALGVNDILNRNMELGTLDDIKEDYRDNAPTFAGYYGAIIQRYKEIEPDAKFFLMTMPKKGKEERDAKCDKHAALLYQMAELFSNTYILDLMKYAPLYDESFVENFFLNGHMNPCGYILTAQMTMSYIDYIIRHNMKDFAEVGLIGTPFKNIKPQ